jgi:Tol biopolymer transport system component
MSKIFKMNTDGTGVTRLTTPERPNPLETTGANSPDFSPGKIVFNDGRDGDTEIFTMDADGTGQRQLTHNTGIDRDQARRPVLGADVAR